MIVEHSMQDEGVEINGRLIKWQGSNNDFIAYVAQLEVDSQVFRIHCDAVEAFATGIADYVDSYKRVYSLVQSRSLANFKYKQRLEEIDAWMESPITSFFSDDWGKLEECIRDICQARQMKASQPVADGVNNNGRASRNQLPDQGSERGREVLTSSELPGI